MIGGHQANKPLHTVIYIHKRAGLFAITPNFDLSAVFCHRDFAAHCGGSLFLTALVSAQGSVYVVKTNNAGFKTVIVEVIATELLSEKLFPSVTRFRISRVRILLA